MAGLGVHSDPNSPCVQRAAACRQMLGGSRRQHVTAGGSLAGVGGSIALMRRLLRTRLVDSPARAPQPCKFRV